MSHTNIRCGTGCVALLAALVGCADEAVNLGGGRVSQEIQRGVRCSESPIVVGAVRIRSQADIEDLAGCEEIDGDLHVEIFAGADLSPLSSLRVVGGLLELGAYPEIPEGDVDVGALEALRQEIDAILAAGYLPTLRGLDNLQRVAALEIYSIAAEELTPLSALRELSGRSDLPFGFVGIYETSVRSLQGLENLDGIEDLVLGDNLDLESLGGIALGPDVSTVSLVNSPGLTSIAELASLEHMAALDLTNLGITDLDSLDNLYGVDLAIDLSSNRQLANVDPIAQMSTESLRIVDNAVLRSIPALPNMTYLDTFVAVGNPALEAIDIVLPEAGPGPRSVHYESLVDPITVIDIGDNAALTRVSLTAGLAEGRFVAIYANPSLTDLTLGTLSRLQELTIDNNRSLSRLDLGLLETVESLVVVDNPALATAPLAAVRTFETTFDNNEP